MSLMSWFWTLERFCIGRPDVIVACTMDLSADLRLVQSAASKLTTVHCGVFPKAVVIRVYSRSVFVSPPVCSAMALPSTGFYEPEMMRLHLSFPS